MTDITISLPDGSKKSLPQQSTALDVAGVISDGLKRATVAAKVNGAVVDAFLPLQDGDSVQLLTLKDEEGLEVFRHSAAHVFAQALLRLFPKAKITIGPPIDYGFFYDADVEPELSEDDLKAIEAEMKKIVKENLLFSRNVISKEQAKKDFADNSYKLELLNEFEGDISTYAQGEFVDLCRGPHIPRTGMLDAFKLVKTAQVYWRGDAANKQLTRVYGYVFPSKKELRAYEHMIEEAKKRDHRRIAPALGLTMMHEFAPGMPFFLPKGTVIYNTLVNFIREEYRQRGYDEVITPQMFNKKLWEQSGHWEHYQDDMFILPIEGQEFSLKPMNCPSHCLIFNKKAHSYRDLPVRIADFCNLHRNELSGTLSGLTRVRKFAQDDAHIFCTVEQIEEEVLGVLEFIKYVWEDVFDFELTYCLSTRPEKKLGDDALWDTSEKMLADALAKANISYGIKEGDGAFYGPKIDIVLKDALGREWQCPTCQLDYNLPARFNCQYEGADGKKHQPVMIHRAILGSLERFFAMLVEHYAGKFPLWLSPEQVRVVPVSDKFADYADNVRSSLFDAGLRVEVDHRRETVSKKVREAQLDYVNYILVVGEKEEADGTVTVRTRDGTVEGAVSASDFLKRLCDEIAKKL